MTDPRTEYAARLDQRRATGAALGRRHRAFGNLRLLLFIVALVIAWFAFVSQAISFWWLSIPVVAFVAVTTADDRVLRALESASRGAAYFEKAIARLDGRWAGTGEPGERYRDPAHSYSEDLDLFGKGSLFELLCTARTHEGEATLASWLLTPADADTLRARHGAIDNLRERLHLREDLAILGENVRAIARPERIADWGEQPSSLALTRLWVMVSVLTGLGVTTAAIWAATGNHVPFLMVLLLELAAAFRFRRGIDEMGDRAEESAPDLDLLAGVLARIEKEHFTAPLLVALRAALDCDGHPPSIEMRKLKRRMDWLESRHNLFVKLFDPVLLWTMHSAFAVEAWRRRAGPAVRRWLAAVGEIEALSALASFGYENPGYPFPEFSSGACFDGEDLAHPLLRSPVPNSVSLGGGGQLLVVSGSNMSGKSTLLRTVGITAVLAQAGAPVRARRLRLGPLAIGASIRVTDSLQGGTSRFYAEITRIRHILDLTAGGAPVLFLLDELLHGTNSHDRRIGAEAIVRGLVNRGAIGIITTHDLALAHIADVLDCHARNTHFEDFLENGRIRFDYRMRPGVVTKSNALDLMRAVGLEV